MAQTNSLKNLSTRPGPKDQAGFSYYALKNPSPLMEEVQEDNIPEEAPSSPEDRYFAVGSRSFYTGKVGAMQRRETVQGRPVYWLDVVGEGLMYFRAEEIKEITLQDYFGHFEKWRTEQLALRNKASA